MRITLRPEFLLSSSVTVFATEGFSATLSATGAPFIKIHTDFKFKHALNNKVWLTYVKSYSEGL